jgi:hypothetical protein
MLEHALLTPALKTAMDRTVRTIHSGNVIPLTTGAQAKDNPIQHPPPIHPLASGGRGRVVGV